MQRRPVTNIYTRAGGIVDRAVDKGWISGPSVSHAYSTWAPRWPRVRWAGIASCPSPTVRSAIMDGIEPVFVEVWNDNGEIDATCKLDFILFHPPQLIAFAFSPSLWSPSARQPRRPRPAFALRFDSARRLLGARWREMFKRSWWTVSTGPKASEGEVLRNSLGS